MVQGHAKQDQFRPSSGRRQKPGLFHPLDLAKQGSIPPVLFSGCSNPSSSAFPLILQNLFPAWPPREEVSGIILPAAAAARNNLGKRVKLAKEIKKKARICAPSEKREDCLPLPDQEEKQFSIILFSGDMDKAMAAFTLACAAASRGYRVRIFFTFWGAALLRRSRNGGNTLLERVFKTLLPTGPAKPRLSRMNFAGLGGLLFRRLLAQRQAQTLEELMALAMERRSISSPVKHP